MPYGYGSANRRGPSGPAGGASAGGNYGGNRNPQQTYGGRSTPVTTGGPPIVLNPPTKKTTPVTTPVTTGGPPSVLNPPTPTGITNTNKFRKVVNRLKNVPWGRYNPLNLLFGSPVHAEPLSIDPNLPGMEWLSNPIDWEETGAWGVGNKAKEIMMKDYPNMTWADAAKLARENKLPFGFGSALNPALNKLDIKQFPEKGIGQVEPEFESLVGGKGMSFLNLATPELEKGVAADLASKGYFDKDYQTNIEEQYPKTLTGHKGTLSKGLIKEDKWGGADGGLINFYKYGGFLG